MSEPFRAGDVVRHRPTGEEWQLAHCEDGRVAWCGWPEGQADAADCELVRAATDEQHRAMLEAWAAKGTFGRDGRTLVARRQLYELNRGYVGSGI